MLSPSVSRRIHLQRILNKGTGGAPVNQMVVVVVGLVGAKPVSSSINHY